MSVTTKVKKTGQVFMATNEWEPDEVLGRDAHELEKGKSYAGHLFDAILTPNATSAEFSKVEWATFVADELEELHIDRLRLSRRRHRNL
ncbi:MAG: hypothetical protein WBM24_18810 [Candidatus Sulfotelmatobacter sp.]